jgi:hypothetical protein
MMMMMMRTTTAVVVPPHADGCEPHPVDRSEASMATGRIRMMIPAAPGVLPELSS